MEVFFVVSGFIIPYSLYRGGYRLRLHWRRFVTKRILRLDPPYLATIVLVIVLTYASAAVPGFKGAQPHFTAKQLLLHLGYLNAFTGGDWVNPVFWTLAIEVQFYLMISAIFPLLVHRNTWVRIAAMGSLAGLALAIHSTPWSFSGWAFSASGSSRSSITLISWI
ncbi:MAG: acyltransferase family protein [Gemmatimonadaceae bacterium]